MAGPGLGLAGLGKHKKAQESTIKAQEKHKKPQESTRTETAETDRERERHTETAETNRQRETDRQRQQRQTVRERQTETETETETETAETETHQKHTTKIGAAKKKKVRHGFEPCSSHTKTHTKIRQKSAKATIESSFIRTKRSNT